MMILARLSPLWPEADDGSLGDMGARKRRLARGVARRTVH